MSFVQAARMAALSSLISARRMVSSTARAGVDTGLVRRESRLIVLVGAVIVLFIVGFAALAVRQNGEASKASSREHVEQLLKAIAYQFGTMMVGIEQTMRHAEDEIREVNTPQRLTELADKGRVSLHLLRDLIFIDAEGRVVVSSMRPGDLPGMTNRSDREYFRAHLDTTRTDSRIGLPIRGRRTGLRLIPVSHAVDDIHGQRMGVLVAFIDIGALERIWADIGLRPDDHIDWIGEDGKAWLSWPESGASGRSDLPKLSWSQHIQGWPIQVAATLHQATVDRHSYKARRTIVLAAVAGSLMVSLLCLLLANRHAANGVIKARLLATIDAIPVEFMEYDREGRLLLVNHAARLSQGWNDASIGQTEPQLLAKNLAEKRALHPDQDWDGWTAKRIASLSQVGSYDLTRPSGESGRFFVRDMPEGGRVVVRVDITESKQREAELLATQDRYRLLFDANPYALVAVDRATGRFLAVSNAAVKQYGWSRDEMLAMHTNDIYPPEELSRIRSIPADFDLNELRTITGFRHRRKDGTSFDVEMILRPFDFGGRAAFLATAQDVSARLSNEKARSAAEEQLRQAQKMEAVGQLTGGIAHDFNNILTVILANADALQDEDEVDIKRLPERMGEITQAVLRAAEPTRQLLAFSRKQPLNPKHTDLNDLVSGTGKMLRRALGEHIEINSVLAARLWTVHIDRTQLETALVNLAVNARDAMPDGGKILIETRNVSFDENNGGAAPDVAAGDYVLLAVTDNGSGMPPETVAKVFEPFFTTKGVGKGTGLGLSMVYGFIKQSNGHTRVYSEVGHGTTFSLYLPRTEGTPEQAAVRRSAPMPRGKERVLIVEDEPQVRASVVAHLESLGYEVAAASDGASGLAAFESATRPFDLLLTDVVMPGALNGRGLADVVTRRWPAAEVIFMSGYTETSIVHHGQLDAGVMLLSKPFRKTDLAQILRLAFDGPEGD